MAKRVARPRPSLHRRRSAGTVRRRSTSPARPLPAPSSPTRRTHPGLPSAERRSATGGARRPSPRRTASVRSCSPIDGAWRSAIARPTTSLRGARARRGPARPDAQRRLCLTATHRTVRDLLGRHAPSTGRPLARRTRRDRRRPYPRAGAHVRRPSTRGTDDVQRLGAGSAAVVLPALRPSHRPSRPRIPVADRRPRGRADARRVRAPTVALTVRPTRHRPSAPSHPTAPPERSEYRRPTGAGRGHAGRHRRRVRDDGRRHPASSTA